MQKTLILNKPLPSVCGTSRYTERNTSVMQVLPSPGIDDIVDADPIIPSDSLLTGCDRVHMPT